MPPSPTPVRSVAPGELAGRLRFAVMRLSRAVRRQAVPGISPSQLATLSTVESSGPITIGRLAETEQVRPPTMTKIVAALVEADLVTRSADPLDRRVAWVLCTPEGKKNIRAVRRRGDEWLAKRLRALPPEDLQVLDHASEIMDRLQREEDRA
ncbi:MAG: MarR family transcriptional regulator [Actinomycetota bacterium]